LEKNEPKLFAETYGSSVSAASAVLRQYLDRLKGVVTVSEEYKIKK